jgi:hypothetical protein
LLIDIDLGVGKVQSIDFQAGDLRAAQAAASSYVDNWGIWLGQARGQLVDLFVRGDVVAVVRYLGEREARAR